MKLKIFTAGSFAVCLSIATADAQDITVMGLVPNSCGTWTQVRSTRETQAYQSWVLGFLSGANLAFGNPDFLAGVDTNAVHAWIDNYCRAKPLDGLPMAVQALTNELRDRAKRK